MNGRTSRASSWATGCPEPSPAHGGSVVLHRGNRTRVTAPLGEQTRQARSHQQHWFPPAPSSTAIKASPHPPRHRRVCPRPTLPCRPTRKPHNASPCPGQLAADRLPTLAVCVQPSFVKIQGKLCHQCVWSANASALLKKRERKGEKRRKTKPTTAFRTNNKLRVF